EAELAVFDLLTQPDPTLTAEQREGVKRVARKLMSHIEERLVLDWRKKAHTRERARVLVKDVLDELPDAYDPTTWERKADIVFNHIFASYYDDGHSVYEEEAPAEGGTAVAAPPAAAIDVDKVTATVVGRIAADPAFAGKVAEQLRGERAFFAVPSEELIGGDETYEVEFKSTARWNVREDRKDKRMEDAVVKTVAGFLNADGGTLFVGVADDRRPVGLAHNEVVVRPQSADGMVNWLTTHLIGAIGHAAVMRTRARIDSVAGVSVCRVDVARSSTPVRARMSDKEGVLWVRMNNSSRELPEAEAEEYVRDHWRE
ncbi:MAG: AlbA family DNA-binding domain-containing protein, partial [Solirubrobacteraceae bacterium]